MNKTPFELFYERFETDCKVFQQDLLGDGSFDYNTQVTDLMEFSNKVNENILVKLFGDDLGKHLMFKFAIIHNRNLLIFFRYLSVEYRLFILHQIKTNEKLYHLT